MRLFAYGTLRRGHANARMFGLEDCECKQNVELPGFQLFNLGWFPGIKPGDGTVIGDLYEITPGMLPGLDSYEGAPNLYTRQTVKIGDKEAFVYVYNADINNDRLIPTGDWWSLKER